MDTSDPASTSSSARTESIVVVVVEEEEEEEEEGEEQEATAGAASMARAEDEDEDDYDDEGGAANNNSKHNDNNNNNNSSTPGEGAAVAGEAAAQSRIPIRAASPQDNGQAAHHSGQKKQQQKQKRRSTSTNRAPATITTSPLRLLKEHLSSLRRPACRHNTHGPNNNNSNDNTKEGPSAAAAARRRTVPYWRLFQYADPYDALLMLVGALAAVVDGFTLPMMVYIQSHLINNFGSIQHNPSLLRKQVSKDCLLFIYVAVVSWIASYFEVSCWMHAGERQTARIRAKYLRSVLRQDVTFFDCETNTPEILNHISADSAILQDAISEKVGNFIKNISHFIGGYLVAFLQLWNVALLMIPFLPFMLLPGILYSKAISGFSQKTHASYELSNTIIEQTLSSIRTVYSFMAEERTKRAYSKSLEKVVDLGKKQGLIKGLAIGSNGIIFAIWAFLGWYGSVLIARHEANGGQVLTTGFALLTGGLALGQATSHAKVFVDGCTAAYKIFRIIDRVPAINIDDIHGQTLEKIEGKLQFQHVSFSYPSRVGVPVLNDFNLEFCPGKTVALVGSSGSGKSTIISLIQRFYDPLSGTILLDGVNLKELQLKWLRQKMGLVSQEPALFATSIKDNLLYANEQASMDDIIAATTLSGAHNFISKLPSGYDTQVGERGIQLSGGQKQRIAIARAVLRDPSILLLDEATSALDTESETLVNQALERASSGRTTILVAHRLSTIYTADVIAVLQHGAVAELWKHEDLLQHGSSGMRSALSKLQHNSDELNHTCSKQEEQTSTNPNSEEGKLYTTMDRKKREKYESKKTLESMKETYSPSLRRLMSLQKPEWRQGLLGLAGAVGAGLIQPFYALLIGELASTYYLENNGERNARIKKYSVEFTCLAIAFFLVNTLQHYNFAIMGEYLTRRIREKMTQKILTFEIGWFDKDENSSGALCSRLASDANMVRSLLGDRISLIIQTATAIAASLIIGLYTSWRLALVMTAIQPIVIYAYFYRKKAMATHAKQESCARQHASQLASEAVSLQQTVTAFCMQDTILSIFESRLNQIKRKMARRSNSSGMCIGIAQFILFASWALDFWYGGQLITNYQSSSGDIFKTFFVLVSTGRVLAEAGTLTPDMAKGSAALEFIFKVLDRDTLIDPENQESEKPEVIRGDVELKDVYFSYPSRPNAVIFHNFNLKINAGSSIALVGQSGSGKSTIIGLIERFYDPLQGKVLIDGKNIKSLQLRMLRQHIGLVNQEPSLFATTIRENILYGKPDCSEDEIIEAARAANAHSFISALPEGYSTMVGAFGLQLSGGQKQRIAIARAILKNPKILLLDEATSALDPESERKVQNALNHAMVNRTTVIVAHRLSTIKSASSIAVLQAGTIVEQGDHNQLMSKRPNGLYFSLVQHQGASA